MMTISDPKDEPMWDTVAISACDFRPHCDGDLINLSSCITPGRTAQETERRLEDHTREIARWILAHHKDFSSGDRFQIILGWPKSLRRTGREVIKTGGDWGAISKIADGTTTITPRAGWAKNIFGETGNEGSNHRLF